MTRLVLGTVVSSTAKGEIRNLVCVFNACAVKWGGATSREGGRHVVRVRGDLGSPSFRRQTEVVVQFAKLTLGSPISFFLPLWNLEDGEFGYPRDTICSTLQQ